MFDFYMLFFFFSAGLYFCFKRLLDVMMFMVMYGFMSMYFVGVMVRLIFVVMFVVCFISVIVVLVIIKNLI